MKPVEVLTVGMDFVYCMLKSDVKVVYLTNDFRLVLLKKEDLSFYHLHLSPFPDSDGCLFTLSPGTAYVFPF